jgi:hypothetical protein
MRSSRKICADSVVTSPPSALNEPFAFEINSPSTSAEMVATIAIDKETTLFVSSVRWCAGRHCLIAQPASAPANIYHKQLDIDDERIKRHV